jgi:hypothetical protein
MKTPLYNVAFDALNHLERAPNTTVFEIGENHISGRTFRNMVIGIALNMREKGVDKTSCVALHFTDTVLATAFTLAISLIGCKWVALNKNLSNGELDVTHIIHRSNLEIESNKPIYKVDESWFGVPSNAIMKFTQQRNPKDIWMIAQSSGTTGNPKNIYVSYNSYWHRANDNNVKLLRDVKKATCLYSALKSSTQYRLIAYIMRDIPIVENLQYDDLPKHPGILVTGSLAQIMHFIKDRHSDTPHDAIVDVTGAATSRKDAEKLLKHFKTIRICYGATETSRSCMKVITHIDQYNGSVGKPFRDVKLKINDGMIHLKTPRNVVNDWFVSGDLGYIQNDELYITGRKNEQLNIGGIKIDPNTIDLAIKSIDGVEDCLVFQNTDLELSEQLSVLVVGTPSNIFEDCMKQVGVSKTPKNVYYVEKLPLNQNGKATRKDAMKVIEGITPIKYVFS